MLTALVLLDGVARIRNVPATSDVVRVENVQTDHFAGVRIKRKPRKRLRLEKGVSCLRVKRFFLRESDAIFDDVVLNFNRVVDILCTIFFNFKLENSPLISAYSPSTCRSVSRKSSPARVNCWPRRQMMYMLVVSSGMSGLKHRRELRLVSTSPSKVSR